jgi:hypothetical protein
MVGKGNATVKTTRERAIVKIHSARICLLMKAEREELQTALPEMIID